LEPASVRERPALGEEALAGLFLWAALEAEVVLLTHLTDLTHPDPRHGLL